MEGEQLGVCLTYYGHSCFTLENSKGYRVAVDPYAGYVPGYQPLSIWANEVYCTHEHRDHSFREAVKIVPTQEKPISEEHMTVPHDHCGGQQRGMTRMYIFETEGIRIGHLGDLGCEPGPDLLERLQGLDAVLIPVGGTYTIDGNQAQSILEKIRPRIVIPMHYRTEERGFPEIDTVQNFLAYRTDVKVYSQNWLLIDHDTPRQTALLQYIAHPTERIKA